MSPRQNPGHIYMYYTVYHIGCTGGECVCVAEGGGGREVMHPPLLTNLEVFFL